jgi:hypothetical protein
MVGQIITGKLDSGELTSKAYVDEKIDEINTGGDVDLTNYYTKAQTYSKTEIDDKKYVTQASLSDYGFDTGAEVNDKIKAALMNYYDYEELGELFASLQNNYVMHDRAQTLSSEAQEQARNNISALGFKDTTAEADLQPYGSAMGRNYARRKIMAVSYDSANVTSLTSDEKAQARTNIGINTIQKEILLTNGTKPNNWFGITSKFAIANISGISTISGSYDRPTTEKYLLDTHLAVVPLSTGVINFCVHYNAYTAVDLYVRLNILCID